MWTMIGKYCNCEKFDCEILDRSQPCKKSGSLSVCHSVRENNSRKSRETLKRFSQNLVLHIFRAREDDLDRSL